NEMNAAKPYAYLAEWKDVSDVAFLGQLIKAGIHVRKTDLPFQIKGKKYERGTLIITRRDNPGEDFDKKLLEVANQQQKVLIPQTTGMVDSGHDFGSGDVPYIKPPKVAIVNGNGVSPTAFGELWHYFEQDLKFPVTVIHTDYLGRVDLGEYDVLVLVSGNYGEFQSKILSFVKNGGKAIAIEGAIDVFTASGDEDPTNLGKAVSGQSRRTEFSLNRNDPLAKYGDRDRNSLSNFVAGTIFKVTLDETHPLAYGQDQHTYILKRNRDAFPYLSSGGWNVGVFKGDASVSGFTGYKLKKSLEDSFSIGEESYGRGKIVYFSDSPVIRGFWHSGKLLLGNAVFY
ncbi:MAG: zinc carboxypeptidase, partial [Bacteroidetes bacterium]|nr:zinc carboxypeptidase [Bacteroidota bacterium]